MFMHILPSDTQVILLLCASFGRSRQEEPNPLTLGEYNYVVQWLHQRHLRPGDLLTPEGEKQLVTIANTNGPLTSKRLLALLERGVLLSLAVERWTNQGIWILGRSDEYYPRRLKTQLKTSAPPILYGIGNQALLSEGGLAVVGSRELDEEGIEYTQSVAQVCAEQGIQIISGGARGVDQTAMMAAVEAGGTAVGVLADSLTKASLAGNYRTGIREKNLTLISPYDPDARFQAGNAMSRNKHVYALADYALVVSSAFNKGGTWAGAVEALEREKTIPIFTRIQERVAEGNCQLLKKGAKPFPEKPWSNLTSLLDNTIQVDAKMQTIAYQGTIFSKNINESVKQEADSLVNESQSEQRTAEIQVKQPEDAFEAVLSLMLSYLSEPKGEKTLAQLLDVRTVQIRDWLNKAVEKGKVKKTKRGYVMEQETSLFSLLDQAK
jgi:predicted Rossmann fold nucleotide-binding protein DprA/Smf involved in DNA uptake